ncbi:MAG: DUF3426 domain-containing protein [Gammaproteobacteria bacterium]
MQTQCPHCHTVFRIAQAQLEMANGLVRCGFCKEIFEARVELDARDNENQRDVFEASRPTDSQQPHIIAENEPERAANSFAGENEILADALTASTNERTYSAVATAAWSLAILVLIAALVTEYLWFNQPVLFQLQQLRPLTARLCERLDCEHLQMRDPSQIELISRNVYSHPNEQDALMISSTMVNHAPYAQAYPDVQIDFSDVRGELIASRRFTPEEYLQIDETQRSLLQSGTPVTFGLEIRDPGEQAITYEFSFH